MESVIAMLEWMRKWSSKAKSKKYVMKCSDIRVTLAKFQPFSLRYSINIIIPAEFRFRQKVFGYWSGY